MPDTDWKRAGEMLVRRRIELNPRYANRNAFAAERGINYRIASDLEAGRRGNYERATLAAAEVAYGLAPGSIARAAAGGELEPLPALRPVPAAGEPGAPQDSPPRPEAFGHPVSERALALFDGDLTKALIWEAGELEGGDEDRELTTELMRIVNDFRAGRRHRREGTG